MVQLNNEVIPVEVSKEDRMQIRMKEINLQFSQSARQNIHCFKWRTLERVILPARILPRKSVKMTCPNCLTGILTFHEYKIERITLIVGLCLMPILMCWAPFTFNCAKTIIHRCPICRIILGQSPACHNCKQKNYNCLRIHKSNSQIN